MPDAQLAPDRACCSRAVFLALPAAGAPTNPPSGSLRVKRASHVLATQQTNGAGDVASPLMMLVAVQGLNLRPTD